MATRTALVGFLVLTCGCALEPLRGADALTDAGHDAAVTPEATRDDAGGFVDEHLADIEAEPPAEAGWEAHLDQGSDTPAEAGLDAGAEAETDVPPDVVDPLPGLWPLGKVEKTCEGGLLATADTPSGTLRFLVLRGSHRAMGRQAGCLVGGLVGEFWDSFWGYFTGELKAEAASIGMSPDEVEMLLATVLDQIWAHMEPFVPVDYLEERAGFAEAVAADPENLSHWGAHEPARALRDLILVSNLSDAYWGGGIEAVADKVQQGFSQALSAWYAGGDDTPSPAEAFFPPFRTSCSFFAAYGARTDGGHLIASRNLDWSTDTGIAALKAVTFYAPDTGHPYATIGFAGFPGALAGISSRGVALSEVGSTSAMERFKGEPWVIRFREALRWSEDLDQAINFLLGKGNDGKVRPTTIGYNWMAAFGDPEGGGAAAGAAALETNGLLAGVHRVGPGCVASGTLHRYAEDGTIAESLTHEEAPTEANLEADAVEVDANGLPRLFRVDGEGAFVLDASGAPIEDPAGKPFPVGRPLSCAIFRGDEAMMHAVRRWQYASHGPAGGNGLLYTSGSYRGRYLVQRDLIDAFERGVAYEHDGVQWVADNGGTPVPIGLPEGETIARAAAMDSNVMSIVYDATRLAVRVSWETGTGEGWEPASRHDYAEFDLAAAFALLGAQP